MRQYPVIKAIEQKYGHPYFRMGLTYLFGKGHENVPSIDMNEARKQIEKKDEAIRAKGHIAMMTVDFQLRLIECAKELANIPLWDLLAYVKDEVGIDGCIDAWRIIDAVNDVQYGYNNLSEDGKYMMDKILEACGLNDDESEGEE